ncbi:MAG: hypothetical protein WC428_01280 [Candidatus Paceibacterota bacterium]|jgi:hypothetical protein
MLGTPKQKYTSAKTSIKQVPAGFKIVEKYFGWQANTINLDIGGGKYDLMTEKLLEKNVTNLIFDPYNRSLKHNIRVIYKIAKNDVDTATIFNVLNVIMEHEIQLNVLKLAKSALKIGGHVFIRSTYKNPVKVSGVTKSGTFQHYLTQKEYLKIVKEIFPNAKLEYGIIYATK